MNCPHCQASNATMEGPCFECGQPLVAPARTAAITKGALIAGRFRVLEVLGRGGMGVVYKAQDQLLDEIVAIKVLKRELIAEPEAARRFRTEIKLARRVSHPNVCRIHEYGEAEGLSFISMALVEGRDLRRYMAEHPDGLPAEEAFEIAIQAARGLQAIHDAGVIHRDFKTPNIMRLPNGTIQLMDFGIAKESGQSPGGLTATGSVVGTPEFMSPEQCRGKTLDARSDVYSLGIVAFELFTGRVPFLGETVMATLLMQLEQEPPLEGPGAERLPPGVAAVLRKALAKAPEQRYERAIAMALALEQARALKAQTPAVAPSRPRTSMTERRASTRLDLPLDVSLKKLGPKGMVLVQERTLADNISRTGLRVMTSLNAVDVNDVVLVEEIGGDFRTQARVRHRSQPADGIWRLGLEFVDSVAPDRLVRTGEWTSNLGERGTPVPSTPLPVAPTPVAVAQPSAGPTALAEPVPPAPVAVASGPPPGRPERRSSSRIAIPLELEIERLGAAGQPLQHERTLAENIGRGGAQVLTAMSAVAVGEVVRLTEVGGDFQTRAAVRSAYSGPDRVQRLNLEFLDRPAPDRLVPAEVPTRPLPRQALTPAPRPQTPPPPAPARVPSHERKHESGDALVRRALELLRHERYWEAIQELEAVLPRARSRRQRHLVQTLLARAMLENPRWRQRAEDLLLEVTQADPRDVEALMLLAGVYRDKGLRLRAERLLNQVLELDPQHGAAAAELAQLDKAPQG